MRSGDDGGRCVGSGGGYIDGCGYGGRRGVGGNDGGGLRG